MISVELQTKDFPYIYESFATLVGECFWTKQAKKIRQEIKGNRFLIDYLQNEYSVVFALDHFALLRKRNGTIPYRETLNRDLYPAMAFAAQAVSFIESAPNERRKSLLGRIRGAMKNTGDLRALQLELQAATHFIRRGHQVKWPEIDCSGREDLFVQSLGPVGLQVECKSISENKGRKIHRRDALEFHRMLSKELSSTLKNLSVGLSVVLTVANQLPSAHADRKMLVADIKSALFSSSSGLLSDGSTIRISEFDLNTEINFDSDGKPDLDSGAIDRLTLTSNREAMIRGSRKGVLIFVVQSAKDDSLLKYIFKTLKEAANYQLDPSKPALLIAGLHAVGSDELLEISDQDNSQEGSPTALRIGVSDFLSSSSRSNVIGTAFLSRGEISQPGQQLFSSGGRAYNFPKKDSPFWSEDFEELFSAS